MKPLCTSLAVVALVACSSTDTDDPSTNETGVLGTTEAVTDVGSPTGAATSAVIGAAGGTLTSADGEASLVVPAGALAADTTLTVTPITAEGPGALTAYRFGPEGTTFASAATMRFVYSAADLEGSSKEALRIAYQDGEHKWHVFTEPTLDDSSVSVHTMHLSDWSKLYGWQLRPGHGAVQLGGTIDLEVTFCNTKTEPDEENGDDLAYLAFECQDDQLSPFLYNWSVNGIAGGNGEVGTVTPGNSAGEYTAPSVNPESNPVAVSVDLDTPATKGRRTLVSNITVGADAPQGFDMSLEVHFKRNFGGTQEDGYDIEGTGTAVFGNGSPAQYPMTGSFNGSFYSKDQDCDCRGSGSLPFMGQINLSLEQGTVFPSFLATTGGATGAGEVMLECTKLGTQNCDPRPAAAYDFNGGSQPNDCTVVQSNAYTPNAATAYSYRTTCPTVEQTATGTLTPN